MAIVETLEIRFQAKLGDLRAQIQSIADALGRIGAQSSLAMNKFNGAALNMSGMLEKVNRVSQEAGQSQSRLSSKLKKTGKAFQSVSKAAKKAGNGIGLHRLDEVNLLAQQNKAASASTSGSSGSKSGGLNGIETQKSVENIDILKKAAKKLPGFFERVHDGIKKSMGGVDEILDKSTGGLAGNMVKLLGSAGKQAASSLVDRLAGQLNISRPELMEKGRSILQAVGDAMRGGASASTAPTQAGSTLVNKFKSSLLGGQTAAKSAAKTVTNSARFGSESARSEAESAGKNLSQGFEGGLLSYVEKIKSAASKLAKAAIDKLKSLLKIASPSKVAFEMGGFFAGGFANGIASGVRQVNLSADRLARGAVMSLNPGVTSVSGGSDLSGMVRAAVNEALGDTGITIPLHVDGVKLGEASIRGINRVTRAAGRLMLEI